MQLACGDCHDSLTILQLRRDIDGDGAGVCPSAAQSADYMVTRDATFRAALSAISTSAETAHLVTITGNVTLTAAPDPVSLKTGDSLMVEG